MTGLLLILAIGGLNTLIAHKRGRTKLGVLALSLAPVLPLAMLMSIGSRGDGMAMGLAAFVPPLATLIFVLTMRSGQEMAAIHGEYRGYVACPFCAEPIREQAVRCRHCVSDLPTP